MNEEKYPVKFSSLFLEIQHILSNQFGLELRLFIFSLDNSQLQPFSSNFNYKFLQFYM